MSKKNNTIIPKGIRLVNKSMIDTSYGIGTIIFSLYILYVILGSIISLNNVLNTIFKPGEGFITGNFNELYIFNILVHLIVIAIFSTTFYMLTNKNKMFIPVSVGCLITNIVLLFVYKIAAYIFLGSEATIKSTYLFNQIGILIWGIIFSIYILKSKRVRGTFSS